MSGLCKAGRLAVWLVSVAGLVIAAAAGAARADEATFTGKVVEDKAIVRSGAGEGFYEVGELSQGQEVSVAGMEAGVGWYKIVPPAGVASAIAKADVQLSPDGKTAKVTGDAAQVFAFNVEPRSAGATPQSVHWRHQTNLAKGTQVQVLGTDGDFLKIAAPAGVYVFLSPAAVRRVDVTAPAAAPPAPVAEPAAAAAAVAVTPAPAKQPAAGQGGIPMIEIPAPSAATAPALPAVQEPQTSSAFKDAEAQFAAGMKKPLEDQPIDQLLTTYQALQRDPTLLPSEQNIVTARLLQLKRNAKLQDQLRQVLGLKSDIQARDSEIKKVLAEVEAQKEAATTRPAMPDAKYDAVGQILASGVYDGVKMPRLYRLVDPGTLRTVAYLAPGGKVDTTPYIGQVVGIIGDARYDPSLKLNILDVRHIEVLQPAKP